MADTSGAGDRCAKPSPGGLFKCSLPEGHGDGCYWTTPFAPAESRSVQKRKAIQRGEEMPTFAAPAEAKKAPVADSPKPGDETCLGCCYGRRLSADRAAKGYTLCSECQSLWDRAVAAGQREMRERAERRLRVRCVRCHVDGETCLVCKVDNDNADAIAALEIKP